MAIGKATVELTVITPRRAEAYALGRDHGDRGIQHQCPYPSGSSYAAIYLDGHYDGENK